jgi:hypothetical protein
MSAMTVYTVFVVSYILVCLWLAWQAGRALERVKQKIQDLELEEERDASGEVPPDLQSTALAVLTERVYLR